MNVIVVNELKSIVAGLNIEIVKNLTGEYDASDIVSMFQNFYFGKMILDITAIRDYKNLENLQRISMSLDVEKIILLLPATDSECTSNSFLSQLISIGIYSFTTNLEGLQYLFEHPNTYKDVAHIHQLGQIQPTVVVDNGGKVVVETRIQNVTTLVVGVKSLTDHSGATSLIFMLKKQLDRLGFPSVGIELNRRDFTYFNDKDLISISVEQLPAELLKHRDARVIFVDLNDSKQEESCADVIYLLEPSILKLNKLLRRDRKIFEKLRTKKIVLVNSCLSSSDIADLEYEAKAKIFFSLPPLNDRANNKILDEFLVSLGIIPKDSIGSNKGKGFSLFGK